MKKFCSLPLIVILFLPFFLNAQTAQAALCDQWVGDVTWCTPVIYEGWSEPSSFYFPIEVGGNGENECRDFCSRTERGRQCVEGGCRAGSSDPNFLEEFDPEFTPLQPITLPSGEELYESDASLGETLNKVVQLTIGVVTALAVLSLIWGGFLYATSDAIFKKDEGKKYMKQALLGLLLAITSVVILNTINPRILNLNVLKPIEIGVSTPDTLEGPEWVSGVLGGDVVLGGSMLTGAEFESSEHIPCVAGTSLYHVADVNGIRINICMIPGTSNPGPGIRVNSRKAPDALRLVNDARIAGIAVKGGGYRNAAEQARLIRQNCSNPNLTRPSGCSPATAGVGRSMHQWGYAMDLKGNNGSGLCYPRATCRSGEEPLYDWLGRNAGTYGYQKLSSEAWHWSINGR